MHSLNNSLPAVWGTRHLKIRHWKSVLDCLNSPEKKWGRKHHEWGVSRGQMDLSCPTPWVMPESVGSKLISSIFTSKSSLLSMMWQYNVGGSLETVFLSFLYCLRRYRRDKSSMSEGDAKKKKMKPKKMQGGKGLFLTKRNEEKRKGCDDKAQMGRRVPR